MDCGLSYRARQLGWPRFKDGCHVRRGKVKWDVELRYTGSKEVEVGRQLWIWMLAERLGYEVALSQSTHNPGFPNDMGHTKFKREEIVKWGWRWIARHLALGEPFLIVEKPAMKFPRGGQVDKVN